MAGGVNYCVGESLESAGSKQAEFNREAVASWNEVWGGWWGSGGGVTINHTPSLLTPTVRPKRF